MSKELPEPWAAELSGKGVHSYRDFAAKVGGGISPETLRRLVTGGPTSKPTVSRVADALFSGDRNKVWALRGEAVQDHGDWDPPAESSYLDDDERAAIDDLIRAIAKNRLTRDELQSSVSAEPIPQQGDVLSVPRADLMFRDGDQVIVVEVKEHASKAAQENAREQLRRSIEQLADSLTVKAVREGSFSFSTQVHAGEYDPDLMPSTSILAGTGSGKTAVFLAAYAHDLRNRLVHVGQGSAGASELPLTETDELALDLIDSTPELLADALPAAELQELQSIAARLHVGRTPGQQARDAAAAAGEGSQDGGGMEPL